MFTRLPSFRVNATSKSLVTLNNPVKSSSVLESSRIIGKGSFKNAFQAPSSVRTLIHMNKLPYPWKGGLPPFCTPKTLDIHYNNIYKKYVRGANAFIRNTRWEFAEFEPTIVNVAKLRVEPELYNNLSGAWNHLFFFNCMWPGGKAPSKQMQDVIKIHFGSLETLANKMYEHARGMSAGGWVWLIEKNGYFDVIGTVLNGSPLCEFGDGHRILLGLDVWEHAYYADYHDGLEGYVNAFFSVVNWEWVELQLLSKPIFHLGDEGTIWEESDDSRGRRNVDFAEESRKFREEHPTYFMDETARIQELERIRTSLQAKYADYKASNAEGEEEEGEEEGGEAPDETGRKSGKDFF